MTKVWFITGCSKGFGRALVEELLKTTDAQVVATARNPEVLKDLQDQYGKRILALKCDVTNTHDIQNAVEQTLVTFSKIDVLVNNAGYGLSGALEECAIDDIRSVFNTNVFGLITLTQAILPIMRAQNSGHILNVSSIAGLVGMAGAGIYCATKFAVEGLSESLAMEVACFGIKVTIIEPGPFRTDFAGSSIVMSPEYPAYREGPAALSRERLRYLHNTQPGDPIKAAQIMIQITEMKEPPLRMLLGNSAVDRFSEKLKHETEIFQKHEDLSRSADYNLNAA
ncbi:SDR family NAD(P)-dependent oxidoreductase [Candidatus Bealeia paramacronuclearis]|uniref:SDR family NAD(P)-dependent oxidoreductase n=1 Tax=Candidatus Bealeia paramacronuclearis TaxID=1921001 RepID=A0ABZ2C0H8_9PROT|nr:SDR family NAD(P)-dependent oxidoreductase [Candidatus Bealeia paramacronuclearis]